MRSNFILAAAIALAVSAKAAGQVAPPAPPVSLTPPATGPVTIRTDYLKASQVIGGKRVDLLIDGDRAAVLEWPVGERYGEPRYVPLEGSSAVLAYLADRRYEFLWPQLTAWTGADLAPFRERLNRKAEALSLQTGSSLSISPAESVASGRVSELIRLTAIYLDIGERGQAQAVMEKYLAAARPRGGKGQKTLNWVLAKARLATILQSIEKTDEALAQFDDIQRVAGRSIDSVNGAVNHAAMLAEVGRYGQALQTIEAAWAFFAREAGEEAITGSERQFAWIRACALNGLGRQDEATATYETLRESGRVTDRDFIVDSKESIEWRAHWCMRRDDDLKRFLLAELRSERPTGAVLALQPSYRGSMESPALLAKMRADPEIRAAAAARMRELPVAMVPALNKYR